VFVRSIFLLPRSRGSGISRGEPLVSRGAAEARADARLSVSRLAPWGVARRIVGACGMYRA